LSTSD